MEALRSDEPYYRWCIYNIYHLPYNFFIQTEHKIKATVVTIDETALLGVWAGRAGENSYLATNAFTKGLSRTFSYFFPIPIMS